MSTGNLYCQHGTNIEVTTCRQCFGLPPITPDPREAEIATLRRDLARAEERAATDASTISGLLDRICAAEARLHDAAIQAAAILPAGEDVEEGAPIESVLVRVAEVARRVWVERDQARQDLAATQREADRLRKGIEGEAWRLHHLIDNITGPAAAQRLRALLASDDTATKEGTP